MAEQQEHKSGSHVFVTPAAIVVTLTPEHVSKAQHCLEKSGAITFEIKAVSTTSPTEAGSARAEGVAVD
jgi:hypothetical protein